MFRRKTYYSNACQKARSARNLLVLVLSLLLIPSLTPFVVAQGTDINDVGQLVYELQQRTKKATSAALAFTITRRFAGGRPERIVEGRVATHNGMYLFDSSTLSKGADGDLVEHTGRRYAFSSDGDRLFSLSGRYKKVTTLDKKHYYFQQKVSSIASQPFRILLSDRFKGNINDELFTPSEVLAIDSGEGQVTVTIDATKRSDYEEIIYTFSPALDWAVTRIEYSSGGQPVAIFEASDFFTAPGSGLKVPGRWSYERYGTDPRSLNIVTSAEASFSALPDADLSNPSFFALSFPQDALSNKDIELKRLALKTRKKVDYLIGESLENIVKTTPWKDESSDAGKTLKSKGTEFGHSESNSTSAQVAEPKDDNGYNKMDDASGQVAGTNGDNESKRSVLILVLLLTTTLLVAIVWVLVAKKRRGNKIIFHSAAITAGLFYLILSIVLVYLCNQSISAPRILTWQTEGNSNGEISTIGPPTPAKNSTLWLTLYDDLAPREYAGRVKTQPHSPWLKYPGHLMRKDGEEIHRWNEGPLPIEFVVCGETSRKYNGRKKTPTSEQWQPILYSILSLQEKKDGKRTSLVSEGTTLVDLSHLGLNHPRGHVAERFFLYVHPIDEQHLNISFVVDDDLCMAAEVSVDDSRKHTTETYKYYNKQQEVLLEWSFTYENG